MRQGQQQKRMRGRNNNRKGPNPLSRSYESNGPDVKIRGTAAHIAEKYVQLARDAASSGDPIAAENYLQHAEHYYRIVAAAQQQFPQNPGFVRADEEPRDDEGFEDGEGAGGFDGQPQPEQRPQPGGYPTNAPQPYADGGQPRRDFQPREQREVRENRDYQPRETRPVNGETPTGLPAFITGGQEQPAAGERAEGEGSYGGRGRNRRRFGRYGRGAGGGEPSAPEGGAPTSEPEIAPGE